MGLVKIRTIRKEEYPLLNDFLYEAIFVPEGNEKPPRNITEKEELQVYVKDFGYEPDDHCLVAEDHERVIGACWVRIMNDYGHIDDETPSLAISLYEEYRGKGIGTELMKCMLQLLKEKGYQKISLSVQKKNAAVNMYKKVGFQTIFETEDEFIMLCDLLTI